jgi:flagellar assembly protein FliH
MPSLEEVSISGGGRIIIGNSEKVQRKAYEEGFASGEKAGFAEGEQKCRLIEARLKNILDELIYFKEKTADELESQVVDLSVAIAKKVIIEEINTNPEIILTMVKKSLRKMHKVGTVSIKINPAIQDFLMKNKSELIDIHPDINIDVDPNVPIDGPHVSSRTEEVITDIDTLLNNIVEEMENKEQGRETEKLDQEPGEQTE